MKANPELQSLVKKLFTCFAAASAAAYRRAEAQPIVFDRATQDAFDTVFESTKGMIHCNLDPKNRYALPDPGFFDALRRLLAFRLYRTYDIWQIAPGTKDEEILKARAQILRGKTAALEKFRDPLRKTKYILPRGVVYQNYMTMVGNLRFLLVMLAHQAKRYGSFAAGHDFLSAASRLKTFQNATPNEFSADEIEAIVGEFSHGTDELKIAADFSSLEEWTLYRAKTIRLVKAAEQTK